MTHATTRGTTRNLKESMESDSIAVDLFRSPHVGEHSADSRADAAGKQQGRDQWTDLDEERDCLNGWDHRSSPKHDHGAAGVKGHHGSQSKSGREHQRERPCADLSKLAPDLAGLKRGVKKIENHPESKLADLPDKFDQFDQQIHLSCARLGSTKRSHYSISITTG